MITYNANQSGQAIDEFGNLVELNNVSKIFNGINVIVFESESERSEYFESISSGFDLCLYKQQITDRVQKLVDETARSFWYDSMIDVATVKVTGGRWENESKSLLKWNSDIWETVEDYFNTIVDEPEMTVDQFIQTLKQYGADN